MPNSSRFCNPFLLRRRIDKQMITNAVYVVILSYLILYGFFYALYVDEFPEPGPNPSDKYDIGNVTIRPIGCAFSISGMYERVPRYICYILLVFTVTVRSHEWLAVGAAASVLTYSGIAAIHMVILFATNNKLNMPKTKSHCESLPIPDADTSIVACASVDEPDAALAMVIVSSVILGALPMAAWSSTFRRSTSKAILLIWLLLLAVGLTFFPLIGSNNSSPSQICQKNHIEPLPTANFQAPSLDQSWRDSFHSLVAAAQQPSNNDSSSACIYSCFATRGYPGRRSRDIQIYDGSGFQHRFLNDQTTYGYTGVVQCWLLTLIIYVTLFVVEKSDRLPKDAHKLLFSIEYRQQASAVRWEWKAVKDITIKRTRNSIVVVSPNCITFTTIHVTVWKVIQALIHLVSVGFFFASIIYQEKQHSEKWSTLSQEPFAAVGRWGSLAVVLMVLVAAGVGRLWANSGVGTSSDRREVEDGDVQAENEDWDWRVGYAS